MKIVINILKKLVQLSYVIGLIMLLSCESKSPVQYDLEVQVSALYNWLERGYYDNEYGNQVSYFIMRDNTLSTQLISHSSDTIQLALKPDTCQSENCFQSVFQVIIEGDTIDILGTSYDYLIIPPHDTVSCFLKFDLKNHKFDKFWSSEMSMYTEKMIDAPIISKMEDSDYKQFGFLPNIFFTKGEKVWIYNQQEEAYKANKPKL